MEAFVYAWANVGSMDRGRNFSDSPTGALIVGIVAGILASVAFLWLASFGVVYALARIPPAGPYAFAAMVVLAIVTGMLGIVVAFRRVGFVGGLLIGVGIGGATVLAVEVYGLTHLSPF